MADRVDILMITRVPLWSAAGLSRLVAAFQEVPDLVPTHWGPDTRARNKFDREELIAFVVDLENDLITPGLRRQLPPSYTAAFTVVKEPLQSARLQSEGTLKPKSVSRFFALADALATQLEPEFGGVNIVPPKAASEYSFAANISASALHKYGPAALCARTWLGAHMADLFTRQRLRAAGLIVADMPWGGVRVDLVEAPREHDGKELAKRHHEAMKALRSTGLFGDYKLNAYAPGASWKAFPERVNSSARQ